MKRFTIFLLACVMSCGIPLTVSANSSGQMSNGFSVTERSTEDILDMKLITHNKAGSLVSNKSVPITVDEYVESLPDNDKNWMGGLTHKQYVEDFESLYQDMKDNYAYFNVALRKKNIDIPNLYDIYLKKVRACTDDFEYFEAVRDFINEIQFTGHISAWGYRYQSELDSKKNFIIEFPEYSEKSAPYLEKLDNPVSKKNYQAMQNLFEQAGKEVEVINAAINEQNTNGENGDGQDFDYKNITTKILKEDKIAYIRIDSFEIVSAEEFENEKELAISFYNEVKDYPHLIVDITDNLGGSMNYFNEIIAAPLTGKKMEVSTYSLLKGGKLNLHYLRVNEGLESGAWNPISEFPNLPEMDKVDLAEMDYFMEEVYSVEPAGNGFDGKLWLLVNENNYSSSEYAAMFSKHSGFATLVGYPTGGDGIGTNPTYFILPHSGIVVQYSPIYGVTPDGRNSEEFGTVPDIVSTNGESPLDTCLRIIDGK